MIDRMRRAVTDEEIQRLARTYHTWRGEFVVPASAGSMKAKPPKGGTTNGYADVSGFCRSATKAEIAEHGYVLTPSRYVGAEEVEDDDEPFEEKMARLTEELAGQFAESAKLEAAIKQNLASPGFSVKK